MMNINGKKISILGAVRSGISAAKLALAKGAVPFVSDYSSSDDVQSNSRYLSNLGIDNEFGGHTDKVFECDFIITSPGVPSNSEILNSANDKRIKVISEIEFASWFCKGDIIGITGTNGKTTTTSLCAHIINLAGIKCHVAGNIGVPFSDIADIVNEGEYVALEVSSFQLDLINDFHPKYSIILNITPDHLDRYEERFDLYIKSKMKIVENQTGGDLFIYNGDESNIPIGYVPEDTRMFPFSLNKTLISGSYIEDNLIVFSEDGKVSEICSLNDISLKGEHNLQNSLAVINVVINIGIDAETIKRALGSFDGVEHRLEFVREKNSIKFINDSKATNVDSVWYALRSFDEPILLILGGKDKGNDYNKIREEVRKRVKKIYAIGSSAKKIEEYFRNITEIEIFHTMDESIRKAFIEATTGDILLLSPACASFDMFRNYEDRGHQFKKIVRELS